MVWYTNHGDQWGIPEMGVLPTTFAKPTQLLSTAR